LYLSDPKVREQPGVNALATQMMRKGSVMRLFFHINSIWIRVRQRIGLENEE
jgi:hypothetical protein